MVFGLTVEMLEKWLKKREYSPPNYSLTKAELKDANYQLMEKNNRILGRSFHHTFEKWYKAYNRIPTPQEFVAMQMKDIKKNFSREGWQERNGVTFKMTPLVEKGLKQRLLRSYISLITELHAELTIQRLFPTYEIVRNDELDYSGIDLLVIDKKNQVEHKIHITKANEYAIDFLFKKEGKELEFRGYGSTLYARPNWKKIKHSVYRERDFKGHTFFLYTGHSTDDVKVINGYPLFRKEYIKNKIEVNTMLRARK